MEHLILNHSVNVLIHCITYT